MNKNIKRIGYGFMGLIGLLLLVAAFNYQRIQRLLHVNSLFEADKIVHNFLTMEDAFPVTGIQASGSPNLFPKGNMDLPKNLTYGDKTMSTSDYLKDTWTTGLLILHKDSIKHESYYLGHSQDQTHISWSMAKSFVATLLGIALEEGKFESIEDPVTKYVPELKGSGYDGVRIKDILQMSSGVRFNEDYVDFYSDINRFGRNFALGNSLDNFCKSLVNEKPPGTVNHYVSIDTQVLGMLLKRITGQSLSSYLEEKIWHPIGMEHDAQWITDNEGMEVALGGLNISLRDYARFGHLMLNNGQFKGKQIVPRQWIKDSVTPDAPHVMPGPSSKYKSNFGYGYQWWIPEDADGAFLARGVYNQFIYIYPKQDLVIVKNSGNPKYGRAGDYSMAQTMGFFAAVVAELETKEVAEVMLVK